MDDIYFTEEDKKKFVDFLNMIAKHSEFKFNTADTINYYKLLSYMQQKLLVKIDANILEVKRVINNKQE